MVFPEEKKKEENLITLISATKQADYSELLFYTSCGPVKFNICDVAGQERFGGFRDGYYFGAECCDDYV